MIYIIGDTADELADLQKLLEAGMIKGVIKNDKI